VGRTLAAEIRRVRIEEAKRLLLESGKSISEIARMSGFGHEDLLARVFRRGLGMTPSQYRRQHQREKA
jgi:AraC-like DNA-binding protein